MTDSIQGAVSPSVKHAYTKLNDDDASRLMQVQRAPGAGKEMPVK